MKILLRDFRSPYCPWEGGGEDGRADVLLGPRAGSGERLRVSVTRRCDRRMSSGPNVACPADAARRQNQ